MTDGDTEIDIELPSPPPAFDPARCLIVGVGSQDGRFIDQHQSVQSRDRLKRIADRYGWRYRDVNEIASIDLSTNLGIRRSEHVNEGTLIPYLSSAFGILAPIGLPFMLRRWGSRWPLPVLKIVSRRDVDG